MVSSNDDDRKTHPPAEAADAPEGSAASPLISEEGADGATPTKDLAVATLVGAVAVLAIILGLLMPNPESNIFTAPGFMPILTGLSLLAMTVGLAVSARKKGAWESMDFSPGEWLRGYFGDYENQWALILMGVVVFYIFLIDWVTFEVAIPLRIAGMAVRFQQLRGRHHPHAGDRPSHLLAEALSAVSHRFFRVDYGSGRRVSLRLPGFRCRARGRVCFLSINSSTP